MAKQLKCIWCGTKEAADKSVRSILCARCVAKLAGVPEEITKLNAKREKLEAATAAGKSPRKKRKTKKARAKYGSKPKVVPSGKPRGWHFKAEYVHSDGTVWKRGKLVK